MTLLSHPRRFAAWPSPRPDGQHSTAEINDALEARLVALNPVAALADSVRPARRASAQQPQGAGEASQLAQFAVVALAAVFLAVLVLLRGDGVADRAPPRALPEPFSARRDEAGRIDLPVLRGEVLLRVEIDPAVREKDAWFWCLDAVPELPGSRRSCAAAPANDASTGSITIERTLPLDNAYRYFVQTYCVADCSWSVQATPLASVASSTRSN